MAFYGRNRMQMQEEMERFEQEIAGQLARPPMPRMPGPNMSLRFIPHQLHAARPVQYAPPQAPYAQGITTAGVAAAALAATMGNTPRFQPIGQRPTGGGAVIEAAPTRYTASTTTGKGTDSRQAASQMVPTIPEPPSAPSATMPKPPQAEPSQSKSSESKSNPNSTVAYTVVGGPGFKPSTSGTQAPKRHKNYVRVGGGEIWRDPSLNEWDPNDFRIFCGDLGNEVSDELLAKAFRKYPSFQKAKVVRDKRTNKTKGYGFVSFKDPDDFTRALREMDGKYVGNRPIKLRKSSWKDRNIEIVKKKVKTKQKLGLKL